MKIENCTMDDFNQIVRDICDFWGSDRTLHLHQPFLVYEFGNTAFVIRENNSVIAYLLGFYSQTQSTAYVHLLGVRNNYQRKGLGQALYEHFIRLARDKKIQKIKAITSLTNIQSIRFHRDKIGMRLLGEPNDDGINIIKNYSGVNMDRVVFEKNI